MNENINLCKILKDCPKGTKLYSPLYGEVTFIEIKHDSKCDFPIEVLDEIKTSKTFMFDGKYESFHKECLLFPSKDQRDWNKFKAPWLKKSKFDPKTLQPFDRVLVRDSNNELWTCTLFSHFTAEVYPFVCVNTSYMCCIPYNDKTKHLVGTLNEAPEFYRYWED